MSSYLPIYLFIHLNLWLHIEVPTKSAVTSYKLNYIESTEQFAVTNVVVNILEYVSILKKLILLLAMSQETSGVSVKFLMVGETNSMVGYHLMAKSHSIQLGVWGGRGGWGWGGGAVSSAFPTPQQVQGSTLVRVRIFWKF